MRVAFKLGKAKEIEKFQPDVVGVSNTMTASTGATLEVVSMAKNQGSLVVLGGHHATFEAENLLKNNDVDVIVRGEGENTFYELMNALSYKSKDISNISGLSFRHDGRIIHNSPRPFEKDLDKFPVLDRSLLPKVNKYPYHFFGLKIDSVETTRGCPFTCKFCSVKAFYQRLWRKHSESRVIEEIASIRSRGIRDVAFVDDMFNLDTSRVERICNSLKENGLTDMSFFCQARVDTTAKSPDVVEKMADIGFSLVFLGIESPSADNLANIQKRITLDQVKKSVEILHDNNIAVWGAYIIGNVNETLDDIKKTIEFALSLDTDIAQFAIMTPLPGTELFQEIESQIIVKDWQKYDFLNCVYKPNFLQPKEVDEWVIKAYKKSYLRAKTVQKFAMTQNRWIQSLKYCPSTYKKALRVILNKPP
ncbi:MAG: cobalamin B12-binding domain-containing protein [Candidatus Aenigmarchaeota archaeon]|nr:cobalamin B12-binding domain-containing protein [Candidatus Aenigmarchaeota archaeon]